MLWQTIRLRFGLRWKKNHPSLRPIVQTASACALIFGAYYLAAELEHQTEARLAAEQAAEIYRASQKVLLDCERGAAGYYYPDGRAFECAKPL